METTSFEDLIAHLERTLGLERASARRVVNEVVAYFDETVDGYVLRRHGELQAEDRRNEDIFARIIAEVGQRRFSAGSLSPRQIRRTIYG